RGLENCMRRHGDQLTHPCVRGLVQDGQSRRRRSTGGDEQPAAKWNVLGRRVGPSRYLWSEVLTPPGPSRPLTLRIHNRGVGKLRKFPLVVRRFMGGFRRRTSPYYLKSAVGDRRRIDDAHPGEPLKKVRRSE